MYYVGLLVLYGSAVFCSVVCCIDHERLGPHFGIVLLFNRYADCVQSVFESKHIALQSVCFWAIFEQAVVEQVLRVMHEDCRRLV